MGKREAIEVIKSLVVFAGHNERIKRAFGIMESATEKQIAKEVIPYKSYKRCPTCNFIVDHPGYCVNCGQRLLWKG